MTLSNCFAALFGRNPQRIRDDVLVFVIWSLDLHLPLEFFLLAVGVVTDSWRVFLVFAVVGSSPGATEHPACDMTDV
ncbi:hypothetical protein TNCV_2948651 [Trichonephila clavipes]|nr:hypothetical protein TNCV_2948651 [Trichonephila clavipes]